MSVFSPIFVGENGEWEFLLHALIVARDIEKDISYFT